MRQLRPCVVNGRKASFHTWEDYSDIVPPSSFVGGHGGGVVSRTFAIVEFEDGSVERCEPHNVLFTDKEAHCVAKATKNAKNELKEFKLSCPRCADCNENATMHADETNKEYFVYCLTCKTETVESYTSRTKALKAFSDGNVKNIVEAT